MAARWLVADFADTDAIRAGQDASNRWVLEQLLMESIAEAHVTVPSTVAERQRIAVADRSGSPHPEQA
jgi:hypothetical protein